MDKLYESSISELIQSLNNKIKSLEQLKGNKVQWTDNRKFTEKSASGISKAVGCYKIIHEPTMSVMSIGQGNISNRKTRHKSVFLNEGVDIVHSNGTSSGSATAGKMYEYDSNLDNWMFSWCDVGNKYLSEIYEDKLIEEIKPEFNLKHMAGK